MRILLFSLPVAIFGLSIAYAGFRHPIDESGEQAAAVQSTEAQRQVLTSSSSTTSAPTKFSAQKAAPAKNISPLKAQADRKVAEAPHKSMFSPLPKFSGPVPKAPSLPEASQAKFNNVQLPGEHVVTVSRDLLPVIEFKGKDRSEKLHNYSRQARMMPLPRDEHGAEVRSRAIAEKYKAALSPIAHKTIRTPLDLHIDTLAKITLPSRPAAFRNMVKRIDALFAGLENNYARGVVALWELSRSRLNPEELRARDSLFAGILSSRAGWETVAATEFESSAEQQIQEQDRYVNIMWQQLDRFDNAANVDRVVRHFDMGALEELNPTGDKANFSLAKKALREKDHLRAEKLAASLSSAALRDRFDLLNAVSTLQPREKISAGSRSTLENLASNGDAAVRDEARLTLARALLREGDTESSLKNYKAIQKNGINRLEVMSEQSYVEFLTGSHPEALGKAVGVESKFFQYGFSPDIHLIETLSRKATCDFGGAEAALQRFANRYVPELAALDNLVQAKRDPAAYYEELISYHAQKEPMRFQRYLLRLPVVMENQKLLNQAERDLQKIEILGTAQKSLYRPAGWDKFSEAMRKNWDKRIVALKQRSGESALLEAGYLAARLRVNFGQAELMGLDLATAASKDYNLQNALNFPVRKLASTEVKKDQNLWPFEQEIWEDELDSLRMKNPAKCALSSVRATL